MNSNNIQKWVICRNAQIKKIQVQKKNVEEEGSMGLIEHIQLFKSTESKSLKYNEIECIVVIHNY